MTPGAVAIVPFHPPGAPERLADLSPREREVLALVAAGWANGAICAALGIGLKTLETHLARVYLKLGLRQGPDWHRRVLAARAWWDAVHVGAAVENGTVAAAAGRAAVRLTD